MAIKTGAPKKLYSQGDAFYEKKLKNVMDKFGADKYDYDYGRQSAWVQFTYKGMARRFEQTVAKMQEEGIKIYYGSDVFAQIVLALEDLERMARRGIYSLATLISALPALPAPSTIPPCFKILQFTQLPISVDELKLRYKELSKTAHPDGGGSEERFIEIRRAYEECLMYLTGGEDV